MTWVLVSSLLAFLPWTGLADSSGIVFVDADRNGVQGAGEPGIAGVRVSNGRDVVATDADGRYALPASQGFVYITRPSAFSCEAWYRQDGGDFALLPASRANEFFFVQVSDAHVYDRISDFEQFSSLTPPWWVPKVVFDWFTLRMLARNYTDGDVDAVADRFRDALAADYEGDDLADLWNVSVLRAYQDEFARPGSRLGDVADSVRAAFREIADIRPEFVIHTGDLVLEGNAGSAEAAERWFDFYTEVSAELPMPVYETIGNNEIAGTDNPAFPPDDPRYGKALFRRHFGPSWYSFDRGPFHFVALDTHRPAPEPDRPLAWSFREMEPDTLAWAEADLAQHADRVLVLLNHEPLHYDPRWPFEDQGHAADDEGLALRHDVPFVLSGHTHWNSFEPREGITHITTGALSGLRWVVPEGLHERGYRLFYARDRTLYSAWKRTGHALIALTEPGSETAGEWILAVADTAGPFASVEVRDAGGASLSIEKWGDYFVRVRGAAEASGETRLRVRATRADGTQVERMLRTR